jgi:hypothetical protein
MGSKSKEEGKQLVWEHETRREKKVRDSKEARQLGAKVKETMNSAGQGAKRVIGAPAVKDARNTHVRDTREFAGAIYSAARGKQSKGTRQSQEQSSARVADQ